MSRPSSATVLWLFARTAVRRTVNSSAFLQHRLQKRAAGEGQPARTGTIGGAGRQSAGGRMMGWMIAGSTLLGGILLAVMGVVTVIESVRIDELTASPRIVLVAEEYEKLRTAAALPDAAAREEAVRIELGALSEHWTGTWTKPRVLAAMQKRYEERGLDGFEAGGDSPFRGDLALMRPAARARAIRAAAVFLMLFNFGVLSMALAFLNRSLSGSDPVLGWLMQFPVSRRLLALSRLIELTFDTPILILNAILGGVMLGLCGASFGTGFVLALLFGLAAAVSCGAFRLLFESVLLRITSRKLRGALLSTVVTAGNLILLFAMLGSGAAATTHAVTLLADRLPDGAFWNPLAPGFGSADFLRERPAAWCLGTLLMACAGGLAAVWSSASMMMKGLASAADTGRGAAGSPVGAGWSMPGRGLLAKEFLQFVRKPELLVQILLSPLLILGLLYLKDPEKSLRVMTSDGGAVCASIFAVAGYVLTGAAGALLAIEFKTLWFLQSLPRSLADSIRTKSRFWGTVVLVPSAGVLVWAFVSQPDPLRQLALRAPFLLAYIALYSEICFGSISLGASVPTEGNVQFRRSMWFLPALAMVESGSALYVGDFWSLVATLIILLLIAVAIRQRQVAELPWISEPADAAPRQLDSAHALIALGAFVQLRDVLGGILSTSALAMVPRMYIAFCSSALFVAAAFLLWQKRTGLALPPAIPRGSAWKPILSGWAIVSAVGLAWVGVLKNSPEITASAHLALELPTSFAGIDREACLRMAALLVVAPIFEEWLFRGLLYRSLRRSWGVAASVALSALLFTVIHPFASSVGVLTLAIVAPLVYERTGRLWASMLVHLGYNLLIMALWTGWPAWR